MNIVVEVSETSGLLLRGSLLIVQIWLFKLQDYIGIYMLTHTRTHAYIFNDYFSNTVKLVHSDTVTKVEIAVKRAGFHFDKPPKQKSSAKVQRKCMAPIERWFVKLWHSQGLTAIALQIGVKEL